MLPYVNARASEIPLTNDELQAAAKVLASGSVCVSTVQRRLRIGWNRAADLIAELKGLDALPAVARKLFP
jgi:DNA segregation ATPase FtsK/SpoIIIE-like protein